MLMEASLFVISIILIIKDIFYVCLGWKEFHSTSSIICVYIGIGVSGIFSNLVVPYFIAQKKKSLKKNIIFIDFHQLGSRNFTTPGLFHLMCYIFNFLLKDCYSNITKPKVPTITSCTKSNLVAKWRFSNCFSFYFKYYALKIRLSFTDFHSKLK